MRPEFWIILGNAVLVLMMFFITRVKDPSHKMKTVRTARKK